MARPSKFTEERREKIITALRGGNYRSTAAEYAGVTYTTLRNWLLVAEAPDAPPEYVQFLDDVRKAEADAEIVDIARIRQASADGSWQAAAWVRERKNPERWGKKDQSTLAITGADGGPVTVEMTHGADSAAIAALAAILAHKHEELKDPLAPEPIEAHATEAFDYEAHRVVPGELGKAVRPVQALEAGEGPQEAPEALSGGSGSEDVDEFLERKEAHLEAVAADEAFTEIVSDIDESWASWDSDGDDGDHAWDWNTD